MTSTSTATPMPRRPLGRTGKEVGVVGLGCWQLGADWGAVGEADAMAALHAAADAGVTFFDTADVYGDGRSEQLVGRMLAERGRDGLVVGTKMGRRASPHVASGYTPEALRRWNDRSRANLGLDTLDLVQLHCPPDQVFATDAVFDALEEMVEEGRMAAYGVSVETCDQALSAIARPNVATVQIILNVFRRKPLAAVLPAAQDAGVGIIARVPLASGLLTGKYDEHTTFAEDDHRTYNRGGEAFDVGETFAGVPFDVGVAAARAVAELAPPGVTTGQLALRWVIDQPGVSVVIPGARSVDQVLGNVAAANVGSLSHEVLDGLAAVYGERLAEHVQHRW